MRVDRTMTSWTVLDISSIIVLMPRAMQIPARVCISDRGIWRDKVTEEEAVLVHPHFEALLLAMGANRSHGRLKILFNLRRNTLPTMNREPNQAFGPEVTGTDESSRIRGLTGYSVI